MINMNYCDTIDRTFRHNFHHQRKKI